MIQFIKNQFKDITMATNSPMPNFSFANKKSEITIWQKTLRTELLKALKLTHLFSIKKTIPLNINIINSEKNEFWQSQEISLQSTKTRKIRVKLTTPLKEKESYPAIVAIHGHGGSKESVYDKSSQYKGFATDLANEAITISTDVGQHELQDQTLTLMGERLWVLIRCVDFLNQMEIINLKKIGCAGLSLGAEMAMWLGAIDTRITATVSSGFLTTMDQMEKNHCLCWKFDGLRELADWSDIFSLIAPRPLLCQNGIQEKPEQFPTELAKEAFSLIQPAYKEYGQEQLVDLKIHEGEHEIDLPSLKSFFDNTIL